MNGEEFTVNGYVVQREIVNRFVVRESEMNIEQILDSFRATIPRGVISFPSKQGVFEMNRYSRDITRELRKEASEMEIAEDSDDSNAGQQEICNRVFIVHGRDEGIKESVARTISTLGLEPIILHEQANSGKTIIEKIETYSDVGFAVVLYTACDEGRLSEAGEDLKPRARQNVVFEHGFLHGRLGRRRVIALVKGEIEVPNDISGLLYIPVDSSGTWKFAVAKELKAAGYSIDMNLLG